MQQIYLRKIERNKTKQQTENLWNKVLVSVYVRKHWPKRYLFNFPKTAAVAYKMVPHNDKTLVI